MAQYINKSDLLTKLENKYINLGFDYGIRRVMKDVENFPAAEVAEKAVIAELADTISKELDEVYSVYVGASEDYLMGIVRGLSLSLSKVLFLRDHLMTPDFDYSAYIKESSDANNKSV